MQTQLVARHILVPAVVATLLVVLGLGAQTVFGATNLISNGAFEQAGSGGLPAGWSKGGWGTNTRTFTYPVIGRSGNAASVTISAYTSGDAKWHHTHVPVTPGKSYAYSNYYRSDIPSVITVQFKKSDGSFSYKDIATLSASADWKQASGSFVVPSGVVSVSVFHLIKSAGTLTIDDVSLSEMSESPTGTINVSVKDVDEGRITTLYTRSQYPTYINFPDRPAGGTYTVFLLNLGNNQRYVPDSELPTTGIEEELSWVPNRPPKETPEGTYQYGVEYIINGQVVAQGMSKSFKIREWPEFLIGLDKDDTDLNTVTHYNPEETVTATIDQLAATTETVRVDIYANYQHSSERVPLEKNVAVTGGLINRSYKISNIPFWNQGTAYYGLLICAAGDSNCAVRVQNTNARGFVIDFGGTNANLIGNASLEDTASSGLPVGWFKGGWGTNNRIFTYPVSGFESAKAAKVSISSYTSGDAKWYHAGVAVLPGKSYKVTNRYMSDVTTYLTVEYLMKDGSRKYKDLAVLPPVATWSATSNTFTVPADAKTATVFHLIKSVGNLTVDAYGMTAI